MGVVMSGGCGELALVSLQLLLIFHLPSPALSNVSTLERCVYSSQLNLSQSHDIICSSSHLHGSTFYHKLDESGMPQAAANMDMIHCEAALRRYNHLNLYDLYTPRDGIIESQIPSGACVISDRGANCTQVILYVNLTYYDQRNDSIIPVCALTTSNFNSECFCIRYLTLESSPDCCDSERCKSVTTEVMMKNPTTIKTEPQTEPQTVQPTNGCPAVAGTGASGRVPAATFQGTISVLIIVIVLQAIVIIMMIGAIYIRKKSSICIRQPVTRSNSTSGRVRFSRSSSLTVPQHKTVESDNGEPIDDERDPFGIHEERHTLLNRSISCPAGSPTAIDPDDFN